MSLIQGTDGSFYGTTGVGGGYPNCSKGCGTIFAITPAGTLTTLERFASANGSSPHAGVIQGLDGSLYGTTNLGGANNLGTVFKISPDGSLTILHSFAGTDGANPYAALIQVADGNFYGTASSGGAST
ncbi:MAG: choice-of-anchor tandem repeat GloVer-containing protein, partial [Candidatus Korobacteraceae bacterium]